MIPSSVVRATLLTVLASLALVAPTFADATDPEIAKLSHPSPSGLSGHLSLPDGLAPSLAPAAMPQTSALTQGTWTTVPPPVLFGAATVYDPVHDRLVVAGGSNGLFQKNVWTIGMSPGSSWQVDSSASAQTPAAIAYGAAIYDPVHARMVVFGGLSSTTLSGEVWCLSLTGPLTWSALPIQGTTPTPRLNAVAAYDSRRNRLLVYGGETPDSMANDLWALDLGDTPRWTRLEPAGAIPKGRGEACGVYDPVADRLVVYGGLTLDENDHPYRSDELWELSLGDTMAWHQIHIDRPANPYDWYDRPFGAIGSAAVYDPLRQRMIIIGGEPARRDCWGLELSDTPRWIQLPSDPLSREKFTAVYDTGRDRVLVFGGAESGHDDCDVDLLSLAGEPSWSSLGRRPRATGRAGAITVFDSKRDRMVIFGGSGTDRNLSDTWALSLLPDGLWTRLATSGNPPPDRYSTAGAYDSRGDRLFIVGGQGHGLIDGLNDVWALSLADPSASWRHIEPEGEAPAPRYYHTLIYDPVRNRLLLFGGFDFHWGEFLSYDDVWALSLNGAPRWTRLPTLGPSPSPRALHSAVYDPVNDGMLVYGGFAIQGGHAERTHELWEFSLRGEPAWKLLDAEGSSPPLIGEDMVFDSSRRRMLVRTGGGNFDGATWELDLDPLRWEWLPTEGGSTLGRGGESVAYDPVRDRLVVFGGTDPVGARNDVWSLEFSAGFPGVAAWILNSSIQGSSAHFVWMCRDGAGTSATIERKSGDDAWSPLATVQADAEGAIAFTDTPPADRWRQSYRVGVTKGGETTYSAPFEVQLQEVRQPVLMGAYPNPSRTGSFEVRFQLPGPAAARLEMIDVRGRVVWARDVTAANPGVETVHLPTPPAAGVYLMRLFQDGKTSTLKTVVLE